VVDSAGGVAASFDHRLVHDEDVMACFSAGECSVEACDTASDNQDVGLKMFLIHCKPPSSN
jgi:hypothetical protein